VAGLDRFARLADGSEGEEGSEDSQEEDEDGNSNCCIDSQIQQIERTRIWLIVPIAINHPLCYSGRFHF